jgi:hypothetical protein
MHLGTFNPDDVFVSVVFFIYLHTTYTSELAGRQIVHNYSFMFKVCTEVKIMSRCLLMYLRSMNVVYPMEESFTKPKVVFL